jgi:hypothetical protein
MQLKGSVRLSRADIVYRPVNGESGAEPYYSHSSSVQKGAQEKGREGSSTLSSIFSFFPRFLQRCMPTTRGDALPSRTISSAYLTDEDDCHPAPYPLPTPPMKMTKDTHFLDDTNVRNCSLRIPA